MTIVTITAPNSDKAIRLETNSKASNDEVLSILSTCLRQGVRFGLEFTQEHKSRKSNKAHHMHRVWLERGAGMRKWPRKVKPEIRAKWEQEAKAAGLTGGQQT